MYSSHISLLLVSNFAMSSTIYIHLIHEEYCEALPVVPQLSFQRYGNSATNLALCSVRASTSSLKRCHKLIQVLCESSRETKGMPQLRVEIT